MPSSVLKCECLAVEKASKPEKTFWLRFSRELVLLPQIVPLLPLCKSQVANPVCVPAAAVDEENLLAQLRQQNMHLESSLQLANAQLSVGKLDKESVQHAYDDAMRQLVDHESTSEMLSKQIAAQEADLQVKNECWISISCSSVMQDPSLPDPSISISNLIKNSIKGENILDGLPSWNNLWNLMGWHGWYLDLQWLWRWACQK